MAKLSQAIATACETTARLIKEYFAPVTASFTAHTGNKNNPHGVTAAQVGAAPDGYGLGEMAGNMPILDDCHRVHLNGWYHVKSGQTLNTPRSDVSGVLRADFYGWNYGVLTLYTPSYGGMTIWQKNRTSDGWGDWVNVSPSTFAPSGYGLGEAASRVTTDYNTCVLSGFYRGNNAANTPEQTWSIHSYAALVVERGNTQINQRLIGRGCVATRYSLDSGVTWQPWEYENPPMELGVEYRTTERWWGQPVYKKIVSVGKLPNATEATVSGVLIGVQDIISYSLTYTSSGQAFINNSLVTELGRDEGRSAWVKIKTTTNLSGYNGYLTLAYTKTEG